MPLSSEPMGTLLLDVHDAVRTALATQHDVEGLEPGTNPKGDVSQPFDLIAERCVDRFLRREAPPGVLLSEESGELTLGEAPHEWCFILDPVNGSDNYARGLDLSAVCLAVLPAGVPLAIGNIEWALVGELESATALLARRGGNAFRGDARVRTSSVERVEDAFVSVELNHFAPPPALGVLMARARGVRSLGCASRALSLVATGALDAHVDIRNRLTPESFFAAGLALEEAGGCLLTPGGQTLPFARNLTQRFSLIAAATRQLAEAIVEALE